jgi:hypothetical protein
VTVAQAVHWFDLPRFYAEARRVAAPKGLIAVWCYEPHTITPAIDAVVRRLYTDILAPDWPPECRLVEERYATIDFPFASIESPCFQMSHCWKLDHFLGYLGSWSASQRYLKRTGRDPLEQINDELFTVWGDPEEERSVTWPLHVRVGQVHMGREPRA